MTILAASARRRDLAGDWPLPAATEVWPYEAITLCTIPTYDGSGQTIHPSVVDMGAQWNGYRWWLADTPYFNQSEALENPTIYGSNDRVTWEVPPGLTNPLDDPSTGLPDSPYNSDTELVYDPVSQRLICYWRYVPNDGVSPVMMRARTSLNGVDWTAAVDVRETKLSPTVTRKPDGRWLLRDYISGGWHEADDPLGPWSSVSYPAPPTGLSGSAHHGAVKWIGDRYVAIYTAAGHPTLGKVMVMSQSLTLSAWTAPTYLPAPTGILSEPYRPTLLPSTKAGWLDVWYSAMDGGQWVAYTRVPLSALPPI